MNGKKLAARAIAGDDDAFLSLMLMHKEALYRTALAYLKNEEDALEAMQEVTFRAYAKMATLKKPEYAKTWLIRVMMNYCRDVLHKQKRLVLDEDILLQQGISEDFTYLEVEDALAQLTDEQRELIHLKYLQDVKIKEIAEMTFTPESTVKTRLYKALKSLRSFFEEKGGIRRVR
ncbi:sigma-70 family RNA polymerase sigma factor [Sporosarcina sp. FSL K6-1522]|uniref:sigma-70 family RNA polymerase sigma factor n=1 Tax=Sporosarcina sp. FSL K6-1522 TaxID=2921554 RepID=UPI00315B1552